MAAMRSGSRRAQPMLESRLTRLCLTHPRPRPQGPSGYWFRWRPTTKPAICGRWWKRIRAVRARVLDPDHRRQLARRHRADCGRAPRIAARCSRDSSRRKARPGNGDAGRDRLRDRAQVRLSAEPRRGFQPSAAIHPRPVDGNGRPRRDDRLALRSRAAGSRGASRSSAG